MDRALALLAQDVFDEQAGIAIVATGGYGRAELSPHSDVDLLVTAAKQRSLDQVAARLRHLLYPLWDAGIQVGHATLTARDAVARVRSDVHALTALLHARLVTGSRSAFEELIDRRDRAIGQERKRFVRTVLNAIEERHAGAGEAGWMLAPDIKNDRGGLRDRAAAGWLAILVAEPLEDPEMEAAAELLLTVREVLHPLAGRCYDRLRPDLQEGVARALGLSAPDGAYRLMAEVHTAARTIERTSASAIAVRAARATGGPRRSGDHQVIAPELRLADGEISPAPGVAATVEGALKAFQHRALTGAPLSAAAHLWIRRAFGAPATPDWTGEMRTAFLAILGAAHVETALRELEHAGALEALIPGWSGVRGLSADDLYHSHTVDAHSFRCVAEVARIAAEDPIAGNVMDEIGDHSTLLLAALLHDVGKGRGEDHSAVGAGIALAAARHMGLDDDSASEVAQLVRHHLLLVDTATRRDLEDGAVVSFVADTLRDPRLLRQLYLLTAADARATGPQAWSSWKADLVLELYRKTLSALELGRVPPRSEVAERIRELAAYDPVIAAPAEEILAVLPPSYLDTDIAVMADELRMLSQKPDEDEVLCEIRPGRETTTITICERDRPGALARSAGVLTLHRIEVRSARIFTSEGGLALQRFLVHPPGTLDPTALRNELGAALTGRLALGARAAEKARDYASGEAFEPDIRMLESESEHSTVIELRAPDRLGLLYAAAGALAELGVDIHVAKIDTLGKSVVDVFYVRGIGGDKLDAAQMRAAEASIRHRLALLFS